MLEELKTGGKLIGLKQSTRAVENGTAVKAFLATDAAAGIVQQVETLCKGHGIAIEYVETMKQLGQACGIDVGAAVAVLVNC